eukprot:COSAG06_NODE_30004_length_546_cov_3.561521_1_plen_47_part_10
MDLFAPVQSLAQNRSDGARFNGARRARCGRHGHHRRRSSKPSVDQRP